MGEEESQEACEAKHDDYFGGFDGTEIEELPYTNLEINTNES